MKYILRAALIALLSFSYTHISSCAAYETSPEPIYAENDFTILDYTALVKPQKGADCGLHGMKNSIALFNYLTHSIDKAERNRQLQSDSLGNLGTMNTCRALINIPGRELDQEELHVLAKQLTPPYNLPLLNRKFLILDNLLNPYIDRTGEQNYQLAEIVENLNNGTPFVHAFLLGNMDQCSQRSGHWIAGVIKREDIGGPITLHLANSSATYVRSDANIRKAIFDYDRNIGQLLMQHLQQLDAHTLRLKAIIILRNALNRNINEHNYMAALINISDIIDEAILHNILTSPGFEQEYRPFLQAALARIPTEFLAEDELEYKLYLEHFLDEVYNSTAWTSPRATAFETKPVAQPAQPISASSQTPNQGIIKTLVSKFSTWWYGPPAQPTTSASPQDADILQPETTDAQLAAQLVFESIEEQERLEADAQAAAAHQLQTYDEDIIDTTETDAELARALSEITD